MGKEFKRISLIAFLFFFAALTLAEIAGAAIFAVNTTNDTVDAAPGNGICADSMGPCSLRAAIMEANALAGADVIQVPAGTYVLTLPPVDGFDNEAAGGDLDITGDLTLTGAGAGSTIIDGNDTYRVFDTRATVSISGVTVTGGFVDGSNGGGIVNSGALTITDCIVTGNSAQQFYSSGGSAGGIYNDGYYKNASLTVVNSTISNNAGIGSVPVGGGIWSRKEGDVSVTLTVINSSITGNSANYGGGIAAGGTTVIQNSLIANNSGHVGPSFDSCRHFEAMFLP